MVAAFVIGILASFSATRDLVAWASPVGIQPIHIAFWLLGVGAIYTTIMQGLRIRRFESSSPNVEFDGLSPAQASMGTRQGYFYRLAFKNTAKNPSGQNSTALAMTAHISIFDNGGDMVDDWEGRWAILDEPLSYGEIWQLNRYDLQPNNQQVILDIGFRFQGESQFQGWDNFHYLSVGQPRRCLGIGSYKIRVLLAASNITKKEWWFTLNIPNEPQADDLKQVEIKRIKKPAIHKKDSQP
ncbi:MAG: hypothetical protein HY530_02460 [Chloroflexi bacterium]|nr:hypothetical protein [Chloroflexota bacterium]